MQSFLSSHHLNWFHLVLRLNKAVVHCSLTCFHRVLPCPPPPLSFLHYLGSSSYFRKSPLFCRTQSTLHPVSLTALWMNSCFLTHLSTTQISTSNWQSLICTSVSSTHGINPVHDSGLQNLHFSALLITSLKKWSTSSSPHAKAGGRYRQRQRVAANVNIKCFYARVLFFFL